MNYEEKISAIKALLDAFKLERYVHTVLAVLSFIVVLAILVIYLARGDLSFGGFTGIAGSGGAIGISIGRILKMWNQALKIVFEL